MDHCPAPSSHPSVLRDGIAPVLTAYARGETPASTRGRLVHRLVHETDYWTPDRGPWSYRPGSSDML